MKKLIFVLVFLLLPLLSYGQQFRSMRSPSGVTGDVVVTEGMHYDIRAYGAVADDGIDDKAAIQAAIDAAEAAGGGIVFFSGGTYKATGTLTVDASNVRLLGAGEAVSIIQSSVAGIAIHFNSDESGTQLNNSVEALTVEGDAGNVTIGIKMYYCVNEGVYIRDVKVTKCDTQIYLDNCWFAHLEWVRVGRNAYGDYGIQIINCNAVLLSHCTSSLMSAGSVGFYITNAEGVAITNCDSEGVETFIEIYDSPLAAGGILIDSGYTEQINPSGTTGSWIILGNAAASNPVRNVTIQNCKITGGFAGGTVTFIDCVRAEDVVISNNTLYCGYADRVHVKTTANTKNIIFTSTNQVRTSPIMTDTGNAILYQGHNEEIYIPASAMYAVSGSPALGRDLSYRSSAFQWTASGSGTNEYYVEASGGGDSGIPEVDAVYEDGSAMTEGTVGSLAVGEWVWGDNDTLGYNTIYVRLTDETDPDGKANDFITGTSGINSFQAWKMPDGATSEIGFTARLPEAWPGTDYEVGVYLFYCTPHGSNNVVLSAAPTGLSDGDDMRSGTITSASGSESTNDYERKSLAHLNWWTTFNRGDILNVPIRRTGGAGADTSNQACYIVGASVRLMHW